MNPKNIIAFLFGLTMIAAGCECHGQEAEAMEGPIRDAVAVRIEKRLDENEAKQDKQAVEMRGLVSEWRDEVRELREKQREEREAEAEAREEQFQKVERENARFLRRLKEWTPGKDVAERLSSFAGELRGLVWQVAALGALMFVVILVGLMAIKFLWISFYNMLWD